MIQAGQDGAGGLCRKQERQGRGPQERRKPHEKMIFLSLIFLSILMILIWICIGSLLI